MSVGIFIFDYAWIFFIVITLLNAYFWIARSKKAIKEHPELDVILLVIPKKYIAFTLVAVLFANLVFVVLAQLIYKFQWQETLISIKSSSAWTASGIIVSLYAITTPWRWQRKFLSYTFESNTTSIRRITGFLILFCYAPLLTPLLCGFALFGFGLLMPQFYYFVTISVVATLVWGVYNLKKN